MRAPKVSATAQKKPDAETLKKRKAGSKSTKDKASKNSDAPKRPSTAFFVFLEEFRKTFKEKFPDIKSGPAVGKAGGEKWKSMSDVEKAPYNEKASLRKAEYEIAIAAYKMLNGSGDYPKAEDDKSISEVNNGVEEEDSS